MCRCPVVVGHSHVLQGCMIGARRGMAAQGSPRNSWADENVALKNVTRHKTCRYQLNYVVN